MLFGYMPILQRLPPGDAYRKALVLSIPFAANVGGLGTPTEVGRQVRRLEELGIDHIAWVSRFGGMPKEAATKSLRLQLCHQTVHHPGSREQR